MKPRNFLYLFLLFLTLSFPFSGCAIFLLGAGAAGGYAITDDEVEGHTDVPLKKAWKAAEAVIEQEGAIILRDETAGKIEGLVEGSEIKVGLEQVTSKTVRVRVKARKTKGLFPDIKRAQDLYGKIIKKINA
ncbi:MAG: DUF3568 family protein [Candidatus Omnitrophica bacterium]|nr:DUF3568 family protein [Candidatus Omnitrophota bacterium]